MVPRFRQVIVQRADNPLHVAYIGEDAIEADAVFERESADTDNLSVRLFIYPPQNRLRFPADEAKAARDMDAEAKRQNEAKARAFGEEATRAAELAEKKAAEARKAWVSLDAETRAKLQNEYKAAERAKAEALAKADADAAAKAKADAEAAVKQLQVEAAAATAAAEEAARKLAEATGEPLVPSDPSVPSSAEPLPTLTEAEAPKRKRK